MRKLTLIIFLLSHGLLSLNARAEIKAYFNQDTTKSYNDPYKGFKRSGDNLEKVLIDQIKSANSSIFVAVQELRLPAVAKALAYQKSLGRDVRVVLENNYNYTIKNYKPSNSGEDDHDKDRLKDLVRFMDLNDDGKITEQEMAERDAIHILRQAKIEIIDDTHDGSLGSSLMHHKFVVIDRQKLVLSSANFTLSGIHGDFTREKSSGNDNSMLVIDSAELAKFFTTEFDIMWGGKKNRNSKFGINKPFRGIQTTFLSDGTSIKVRFSPTSGRKFWNDSTNGFIASEIVQAKKSIESALFVFSDQKLSNALEAANDKGVSINMLVEPKFAYRDYSEVLDMFGLAMFNSRCEYEADNKPWGKPSLNIGVALKNNRQGDLLHHKYAVIDGEKVIFGSHNWSEAANYQNDEFLMVIENKKLAKAFKKEFERLNADSNLGAPKWLTDRIQDHADACRDRVAH